MTNDPSLNPAVKRGLEDGFYKPVGRAGFVAAVLIGVAAVVNAAPSGRMRTVSRSPRPSR